MSVVFDHPWLGGLFADPDAQAIWSAERQLAHMIAFEAAWTRANAAVGLLEPEGAARAAAAVERWAADAQSLRAGTAVDGLPVPALVRALKRAAGGGRRRDPRRVHLPGRDGHRARLDPARELGAAGEAPDGPARRARGADGPRRRRRADGPHPDAGGAADRRPGSAACLVRSVATPSGAAGRAAPPGRRAAARRRHRRRAHPSPRTRTRWPRAHERRAAPRARRAVAHRARRHRRLREPVVDDRGRLRTDRSGHRADGAAGRRRDRAGRRRRLVRDGAQEEPDPGRAAGHARPLRGDPAARPPPRARPRAGALRHRLGLSNG